MNIVEVFNVSNNNNKEFLKNVGDVVSQLQNDGQKVEIQYQTSVAEYSNSGIIYSALIIGRK